MCNNNYSICLSNLIYNDKLQVLNLTHSENRKNLLQIREEYQGQIAYQREYNNRKIFCKQ